MGIPAIAMSLGGENNYVAAARVAKLLAQQVIADPLPADTILNVNVPDTSIDIEEDPEVALTKVNNSVNDNELRFPSLRLSVSVKPVKV